MDFLSSILWLFLGWALIRGLLSAIRARNRKLPLPPGPIPYPIVGNLFKLGDKPHKSLAKLAKIHGPIMSLELGQITTIVISSSTLAKEVLQTNDLNFSYRAFPECTKAHNHHKISMVWLPPAIEWRNLRKLSNSQIFAARTLDANQHLRRQKVAELLEYVQEHSMASLPVDIGRAAFVTSLNLLSNTVFSADLVNPRSDSAQEFKDLTWDIMEEIAKPNLADYFPVLRSIDPQGRKRRLGSLFGKMFDIFNNLIEQRLQSSQGHGSHSNTGTDVLEILLGIIGENKEIDRTMLLHLFLDLFTAGSDTSSSTIEWAMAEILSNPVILSKVQNELNQVVGKDNTVKESDIVNLPYLQAIVKETLRLHPAAPLLVPRTVVKDEEVLGFLVPKNARVLINAWAIGRDQNTWVDPDTFVPERFLGSDIDIRGRNFELIPFGGGRRICPGLPLAMRMVHLMLGSLLHSFNWRPEEGVGSKKIDMDDKFGLTLQKSKPLLAVPVKV